MAKVRPYRKNRSKNYIVITDEQLTKAIVQAYNVIDQRKYQKAIDEKNNWRKKIGLKEQIADGPKIKRYVLNFVNALSAIFKLLFIKRKNVREGMVTTGLLKMALSLIFSLLNWTMLLCAIVWFLIGICYVFKNGAMAPELIGFSVAAFVFSRLFRIAVIEVEYMEDKDYLVAIFSGVTSFAAMIVAIIALVKG